MPVAHDENAGTRQQAKRWIARALLAVAFASGVLWLVFLRPTALGGSTEYILVSGTSMEPTLHEGDLVILRQRDRYEIGDVVAFDVPEGTPGPDSTVIHRIIGGNADDGYVTRGDNRESMDAWHPTHDAILGARVARVPYVGRVLGWLAHPFVLGLAIGAAGSSLVWLYRLRQQTARQTPTDAEVTTAVVTREPAAARATPATATPNVVKGAHHHRRGGSPHDVVAARIRHRYERTSDPELRLRLREAVFELAMTFAAEDPDFDAAAFLRACGAHAYDVDATQRSPHQR
ncbi:MAG TPA: signal peptidase I [Acidimicrobiales bacterium]